MTLEHAAEVLGGFLVGVAAFYAYFLSDFPKRRRA